MSKARCCDLCLVYYHNSEFDSLRLEVKGKKIDICPDCGEILKFRKVDSVTVLGDYIRLFRISVIETLKTVVRSRKEEHVGSFSQLQRIEPAGE